MTDFIYRRPCSGTGLLRGQELCIEEPAWALFWGNTLRYKRQIDSKEVYPLTMELTDRRGEIHDLAAEFEVK